MRRQVLTRKTFLKQCAAGLSAFALGCPGDDGGGDDGASTGGNTTGGGPTSASGMSSTDPSEGSTSEDDTTGDPGTGSSGEGDTGTSSGGTSGSESGASSSSGEENACTDKVVVAAISLNHGHTLEIPIEDVMAGVETTYDATGDSTHCHEVTLTMEDFATLRAGGVVTKFSCNGGDHEYVLSCAPKPPEPVAPDCSDDPNFGACP